MALTITQTILSYKPNHLQDTFTATMKVEGLIVEGATNEDHLLPLISSEHLNDSPAFFLKVDLEKLPKNSSSCYKLKVVMESVECIYNKVSSYPNMLLKNPYDRTSPKSS